MLSVNYICVYKVALIKAKEGKSTINSFGEKESLLPVVLLGDVSVALVGHTAATVGQLKHGRDAHVTTLITDIKYIVYNTETESDHRASGNIWVI